MGNADSRASRYETRTCCGECTLQKATLQFVELVLPSHTPHSIRKTELYLTMAEEAQK